MTDHELNEKIARLCGTPSFDNFSLAVGHKGPFLVGWALHTAGESGACTCEPWDPVGDWRQVHKYVIPALQRAGCIVEFRYDDSPALYMEIKPKFGGWIAVGAVVGLEPPPPRPFCELALEAWENLEEATE